jgi:hypothetical protein
VAYRVLSYVERPDLADRWEETVRPAWPEFLLHDATVNATWGGIFDGQLAEFQFFVCAEEADEVLGVGNCVPIAWDGDPATLPNGVDEVVPLAIEQSGRGIAPTAISALQAVVTLGNRGRRLSAGLSSPSSSIASATKDATSSPTSGCATAWVADTIDRWYPRKQLRGSSWSRPPRHRTA